MYTLSETRKICATLNILFVIPTLLVKDASHSEFNVFGSTVTVIICWFHLLFNVKKHPSLDDVSKTFYDMV